MSKPKYLLIDLETSGVDFTRDSILEIGAMTLDADLNPIDDFWSGAIHADPSKWVFKVDPFVVQMHTVNGLWAECLESKLQHHEAMENFYQWLLKVTPGGGKDRKDRLVAAGFAVANFDVPMLRQQNMAAEALLSYQTHDISGCFDELALMGFPQFRPPKSECVHRAVPDCIEELEAWRNQRRFMGQIAVREGFKK